MSDYARAAFRLLTPFRGSRQSLGGGKDEVNKPGHKSSKQLIKKDLDCSDSSNLRLAKQELDVALTKSRPFSQIGDSISCNQNDFTLSQLTMSQLSNSNESINQRSNSQQARSLRTDMLQVQSHGFLDRTKTTPYCNTNKMIAQPLAPNLNNQHQANCESTFYSRCHNDTDHNVRDDYSDPTLLHSQPHLSQGIPSRSRPTEISRPYCPPPCSNVPPTKKRSWMETCIETFCTPYRKRNKVPTNSSTVMSNLSESKQSSIKDVFPSTMTPSLCTVGTTISSEAARSIPTILTNPMSIDDVERKSGAYKVANPSIDVRRQIIEFNSMQQRIMSEIQAQKDALDLHHKEMQQQQKQWFDESTKKCMQHFKEMDSYCDGALRKLQNCVEERLAFSKQQIDEYYTDAMDRYTGDMRKCEERVIDHAKHEIAQHLHTITSSCPFEELIKSIADESIRQVIDSHELLFNEKIHCYNVRLQEAHSKFENSNLVLFSEEKYVQSQDYQNMKGKDSIHFMNTKSTNSLLSQSLGQIEISLSTSAEESSTRMVVQTIDETVTQTENSSFFRPNEGCPKVDNETKETARRSKRIKQQSLSKRQTISNCTLDRKLKESNEHPNTTPHVSVADYGTHRASNHTGLDTTRQSHSDQTIPQCQLATLNKDASTKQINKDMNLNPCNIQRATSYLKDIPMKAVMNVGTGAQIPIDKECQPTIYKTRRHKVKTYGKRTTKSFDWDPFEFL